MEARDPITPTFDAARDHAAYEHIRQEVFEIRLDEGILSREQISRQIDLTRAPQALKAEHEKESKQRSAQVMFMLLLDQIRERVAELQESMAQRYETLKAKYGERVVDAMIEAFLPDVDARAMSEQQKRQALAAKFLDETGKVKAEYAHLEEARYVRDWQEMQKLKPILAHYEGRSDITAAEQRALIDVGQALSNADNESLLIALNNAQALSTLEAAMNGERADHEEAATNAPLPFR